MSRVSDLVEYHLTKEKIVYKFIEKSEVTGKDEIMYQVKSIKEENQSYVVVCKNDIWYCDCPSFKYKTGTDANGNCKHIMLIIFLNDNKVEIEEI